MPSDKLGYIPHKTFSKIDIESIFEETRMKQNNGESSSEMVHLDYLHKKIEEFVQQMLKNKELLIICKSVPVNYEGAPVYVQSDGNEITIFYVSNINKFAERLSVAEGLGQVVLQHVPNKLPQKLNREFSGYDVIYFAQMLLEIYSEMENGAILRGYSARLRPMIFILHLRPKHG